MSIQSAAYRILRHEEKINDYLTGSSKNIVSNYQIEPVVSNAPLHKRVNQELSIVTLYVPTYVNSGELKVYQEAYTNTVNVNTKTYTDAKPFKNLEYEHMLVEELDSIAVNYALICIKEGTKYKPLIINNEVYIIRNVTGVDIIVSEDDPERFCLSNYYYEFRTEATSSVDSNGVFCNMTKEPIKLNSGKAPIYISQNEIIDNYTRIYKSSGTPFLFDLHGHTYNIFINNEDIGNSYRVSLTYGLNMIEAYDYFIGLLDNDLNIMLHQDRTDELHYIVTAKYHDFNFIAYLEDQTGQYIQHDLDNILIINNKLYDPDTLKLIPARLSEDMRTIRFTSDIMATMYVEKLQLDSQHTYRLYNLATDSYSSDKIGDDGTPLTIYASPQVTITHDQKVYGCALIPIEGEYQIVPIEYFSDGV